MAGLKPSMCRGLLCRGFSVLRGPTWWCHLAQAVSEEPTLFKLLLFKKESHRANLQRRKHCFKPSLKWRRSCEVDSCEVDHRKIILSHIESNNFHLKKRYRGKANNVYSVPFSYHVPRTLGFWIIPTQERGSKRRRERVSLNRLCFLKIFSHNYISWPLCQ